MSSNGYTGFGYWKACPSTVAIAWGARAIYKRGTFDVVWDRQDMNGTGKDEPLVRKSFVRLLNRCMSKLEAEVMRLHKAGELRADEEQEFTFNVRSMRFVFNTNGSCGYLYILAYLE